MGRARLGPIHALGLPAVEGPGVLGGTGASTCVLGGGGKKTREPSVSAERAEAGAVRRLPGAREETWSLPPADNSEPQAAPTQLAPKDHGRSLQPPALLELTPVGRGLRKTQLPLRLQTTNRRAVLFTCAYFISCLWPPGGGQGQNALRVETHVGWELVLSFI